MPQLEDLLGTSCHGQSSLLEQAIEDYQNAKEDLSSAEEQNMVNYITCLASVNAQIMNYRKAGQDWRTKQFTAENGDSAKLGRNLTLAGKANPYATRGGQAAQVPNRVEARHIIPASDGRFEKAIVLRARLGRAKIRIDDPDNGVWLPKGKRDRLPGYSNAVPHRRIHREGYYRFLSNIFLTERNKTMFRVKLNAVAASLKTGDVPDWMMLPKNQLPDE